jgi:hypothetical protein
MTVKELVQLLNDLPSELQSLPVCFADTEEGLIELTGRGVYYRISWDRDTHEEIHEPVIELV